MNDLNNNRRNGIIGTLLFHGVVLLILLFCGLSSIIPEEEEGILVNFGSVNAASGEVEPDKIDQPSPQPVQPPPPPVAAAVPKTAPEQVTTQDLEEAAAMKQAEKKKKKEQETKQKQEIAERKRQQEAEAAEKRRKQQEEAERQRKAQEEQRRVEAIRKRASGAFATGNTTTSQGDAESGTGNQGSPFGNANSGANEGVGGYGTVALSGRSLRGQLPRPSYQVQEEGKIVVDITVDKDGNVIATAIGRGTNIDNQTLRSASLTAARQAKFNTVTQNRNQTGTITYKFNLR